MELWEAHAETVWVTLRLASLSTVLLLLLGTPLAWWLARTASPFKALVQALVSLPLVLPPTVLGFYLLVVLGPNGPVGWFTLLLGLRPLVFSFGGLVAGSVLYSLPFVVQPITNSFVAIGTRPLEAASTLRAGPLDRFFTVAVPLARQGLLTATVLGFAHTVGEFGIVLMIGGSIPGETKVLSIAIFEHVEAMEYTQAHLLAFGMLMFALLVLLSLFLVNRRFGEQEA